MKRMLGILIFTFMFVGFAGMAKAQTTQVDALIRKLVDKGILDKKEAIELKSEIAADEKTIREETKASVLPEWVSRTKIKGDVRLRHQYERRTNDTEARNRSRIRYRLGVITNPTNNVEVGAGLASGGQDPRSTNQTLENSFETPDIRLDYAYAQWKPREDSKIIGGKFERKAYLWAPTDILWDSDITPNGIGINYEPKINDSLSAFFNGAYLIIDENGKVDKADPFLKYVQGGLKYKQGMFDATMAGTRYSFNSLDGTCPDWSSRTNSGLTGATVNSSTGACTGGALVYDYDSIVASSEFGFKKLFGGLPLNADGRIAFFGDFIHNPHPNDENNGWAYGMRIGTENMKTPGDWEIRYVKVILEKDAWVDFMSDSDRLGGATNIIGHEGIFEYVWKENVTFGMDYYISDLLNGSENREKLVQADMVFKF